MKQFSSLVLFLSLLLFNSVYLEIPHECTVNACAKCEVLYSEWRGCRSCHKGILVNGKCEETKIENCEYAILVKNEDLNRFEERCHRCSQGYAMTFDKKKCTEIPEKIEDFDYDNCVEGYYSTKNSFRCTKCKGGNFVIPGTFECIGDYKNVRNCELGGDNGFCAKCKQGYVLSKSEKYSSCTKEIEEGCAKYYFGDDYDGCIECNYLNRYYAIKSDNVPNDPTKFFQKCQYFGSIVESIRIFSVFIAIFITYF